MSPVRLLAAGLALFAVGVALGYATVSHLSSRPSHAGYWPGASESCQPSPGAPQSTSGDWLALRREAERLGGPRHPCGYCDDPGCDVPCEACCSGRCICKTSPTAATR